MNKNELLHFRIIDIKQETTQAKTYQLELLNRKRLQYKPGQFLTFILAIGGHEYRRSYSILSLPDEPLKITVKKVENGAISRYILQEWKIGNVVYSIEPAGRFILEAQTDIQRDIFCFAAGSGIVPILPQIKHLLQKETQSIIHLIYSNYNEADALFLDEIESLAHFYPKLHLINLFSEPTIRLRERGRLSNLSAEEIINKHLSYLPQHAVFLLCGPFSYMRMLNFTIVLLRFPKENIKRENFIPEIMRAGQAPKKIFPETNVTIKLADKISDILVHSGEDILSSAQRHGLTLPYSCKGGVCGNCAAKCTSGKVYMSINEVLNDADLHAGWILTCTGYPEGTNVVIDFNHE